MKKFENDKANLTNKFQFNIIPLFIFQNISI